MNKSQNYPWKMYGDFFLLAGPREEAQAILNEEAVFDGRAVQEVGSGGAYALFYVDWKEDVDSGQWDHLKDRLGRNPRCEAALVLYTGTWYWSEKPLNDRWTGGEWYDDSWDEYAPPWADLLLKGGARTGSLVVRGSEAVQWPTGGGSGDWLEGGTLTVARLAELCNPYVKPVKSREFYQKFRKELPGFDGVSAIELTQVEEKWVGGDDEALARLFKLEGAAKAGDLTRLRYVDSYVSTKTTWLCNLETHEVVKRVLVSIHVPQDPAAGEYRYVNLTLDKREIVCKPLAGIPAGDEADLLWDGGTCRFCFSNRERLVVPAQNPDTGEAAQGVGDMCFQGVDQVKRVVLPNTVTVLGTGAFSGCKKLEYVSFQDDPDSKADFVLRKKGDLLALFTKKTAYEIPKDVTKIGKFAFSSCNKLKSVTLHGKLKPLLKDSLAGCKSLKTVVLQSDVKAVEWLALARGNIQTVVLADGTQVHTYDNVYLYNCFTQSEAGIGFDYAKAAQLWQGVKKESSRFQFCLELLTEHAGDCGAELKAIVDFAIRYAIGKGDMKSLDAILKAQPNLELGTEKLVDLANRSGKTEAAAMLLNHRAAEPEEKKIVVRRETPAERKWPWFRYIQVRFENNKAYKYRCDFDVRVGDKVFVEGKMAGHPGEVTALLLDRPSGRAELYTQSVTEAYNVTIEEVDSLFSLD